MARRFHAGPSATADIESVLIHRAQGARQAVSTRRRNMVKKVADQFAEILTVAGVKRVYGIVGDGLNGLTDSLRRQDKIEWIHVPHD
jgi:hypothetical protein